MRPGAAWFALTLATALSGTVASVDAAKSGPTAPAMPRATFHERTSAMRITIRIQDRVITATLADNATAKDFAALLPMTVTLDDYASTEKITDLPKRLSTEGAPAGVDPSIGDITYYAPWGNLAIFYRDFGYSSGLIKLGTIDAGMEALNVRGSMQATIELADGH
ncbi:cyclophilin-like fold protein [Microvirga sp. M2]|uniref:cyclophilin-like fold protein n=1 Tax=Microvirga sp. M2 TaxID=3073270 RepID=UPI0039C42726